MCLATSTSWASTTPRTWSRAVRGRRRCAERLRRRLDRGARRGGARRLRALRHGRRDHRRGRRHPQREDRLRRGQQPAGAPGRREAPDGRRHHLRPRLRGQRRWADPGRRRARPAQLLLRARAAARERHPGDDATHPRARRRRAHLPGRGRGPHRRGAHPQRGPAAVDLGRLSHPGSTGRPAYAGEDARIWTRETDVSRPGPQGTGRLTRRSARQESRGVNRGGGRRSPTTRRDRPERRHRRHRPRGALAPAHPSPSRESGT